jgi:hypothetical protein
MILSSNSGTAKKKKEKKKRQTTEKEAVRLKLLNFVFFFPHIPMGLTELFCRNKVSFYCSMSILMSNYIIGIS